MTIEQRFDAAVRFRCERCKKIPRGKVKRENAARYYPYCSYHCQEWARLENASEFVRRLPSCLK